MIHPQGGLAPSLPVQTTPEASDEQLPDALLLQRFLSQRDEAAFRELVRRHGALVLGVCERVLHNPHDAQDAFQATFLVLARRASAIRKGESLGSWLYGVAYRIAKKALAEEATRRKHETRSAAMAHAKIEAEADWGEVRQVLDDELSSLPEKYRSALLLCYLENKTQEEAARQLGWAPGVLRGRLDRGRERLRKRLLRRGLAISSALLATVLVRHASAAPVSALTEAAIRGAVGFSLGGGTGVISERVAAMAEGGFQTMSFLTLKSVVATILVAGLLTTGALAWWGVGSGWFFGPFSSISGSASSGNVQVELDPDLIKSGLTRTG
jgi:RNA polymerase sigma factor (sigma-70 family)